MHHTPAASVPTRNGQTVEVLAASVGVRIQRKHVVRVPITQYATLVDIIERNGLTGRLFLDFSQGSAGWVTWEQNQ